TGDEVPEPVRRIGSAVGSFLLGGPVVVAINLATLLAEKVSGIDLDRSGQALLAALVGSPAPSNPSVPIEEHGDPEPLSEADALNARELERLHAADRPALALASAASPPHVMEEWTGPAARSSERVAGPAHGAAPVHRSATLREQAGAAHDHVAAPREHAAIVRDRTEMARDQSTATDDLWTAARARAAYDREAGLAGFASQGLG
ncbi:MAG: hypothetical protein J0H99_18755, partial [Rhodospirillales bacterium]|nr:hypothetical protein [Rhodospirillales bacterium]